MKKQSKDDINQVEKMPARDPDTVDIDDIIRVNCFELAEEYIKGLDDPAEIKQNNGLFVDMLKYIYNKYLIDILNNGTNRDANRYDFRLLDKVFSVYSSLVYKYKQNKRCSILEFTIFSKVNHNTLYNASYGQTKKLTPDDVEMVKRWFRECENSLTNGTSVFEIFLLKSQYRYNDNLAPIPISDQGPALGVSELPDLGIQKIAKKDNDSRNE